MLMLGMSSVAVKSFLMFTITLPHFSMWFESVISEVSKDQEDYAFVNSGLVIAPYDKIADAVAEYLQNPKRIR